MPQVSRQQPVIQLEGLSVAGKSLVVSFSLDRGPTARFSQIAIPAELLLDPEVLSLLDNAARRRLKERWERWSEGEADLPLW